MNSPTPEQLAAYELKLKEWHEYMDGIKPWEPKPEEFDGPESYKEARLKYNNELAEWEMKRSCDAPNKPGYYRANND